VFLSFSPNTGYTPKIFSLCDPCVPFLFALIRHPSSFHLGLLTIPYSRISYFSDVLKLCDLARPDLKLAYSLQNKTFLCWMLFFFLFEAVAGAGL